MRKVPGERLRTHCHIEEFGRKYLAYGKEQCKDLFVGITKFLNREESGHEKF